MRVKEKSKMTKKKAQRQKREKRRDSSVAYTPLE